MKSHVVLVLALSLATPTHVTAQTGSVEVLLNSPFQYSKPADRCEAEICTRLLEQIDGARSTIDFAVYGMRHQSAILEALLRAQRRGVFVRGLVDRDRNGGNYYVSTDEWVGVLGTVRDDRESERELNEAERNRRFPEPRCERPPGFEGPLQCLAYDLGNSWLFAEHASREDFVDPEQGGFNRIMHHKFFVIDGRYVWTGSANISDSGTGGYNANAVVVLDSPQIAELYTREFTQMYVSGLFHQQKLEYQVRGMRADGNEIAVFFSPKDRAMQYGVEGLLARSKTRIDVAVFFLTNKYAAADLIAAHQRGVKVRVIVDATAAKNGYTKHEVLREAGIPVKIENWGGKMHMKAAAIDSEYLVLGSMNWTGAGENTNDENSILLRSRQAARQFEGFFEELWRSIPDSWSQLGARPDPESMDSGTSCTDEVDNDFDDLIDADDPSCGVSPPPLLALPPHVIVSKRRMQRVPSDRRLYVTKECDGAYPDWYVCLPKRPPARDVNCGSLPYQDITVNRPDPHNLDGDGNGHGCERPRSL